MRFAAYAGASVALATSVVLKALHERANFYSVCVYLAQSSACIMILSNLVLLALGCLLYGLQKLLYGPLRPIEIEQLYEKAWFAVTETCLAMTVFRTEVGAFFIVMFVSLLVGKVWQWMGEGRVEFLEQQPPSNPRLFHARMASSLALSFLFDAYFLNYAVTTVAQQAEPNMMVMFAFEFAVLTVSSLSTCARYVLSLREAAVIQSQTTQRLNERRRQRLQERNAATEQARENGEELPSFPPLDEEIDELDIDVPGWEEKGRWVFYLDLATDFLKLVLYLTFFCVLCIFHGMPIHIIRDVALTVRSFYNRVTDFIKYRHATKDMNERYPDATAEEIQREDTCIICREPMRPWQAPEAVQGEGPAPMEERLRPKKLPCGHILHFACLRSWLERQQKCPTCRQDVVAPPQPPDAQTQVRHGQAQDRPNQNGAPRGGENRANGRPRQNRVHYLNLGPFRVGVGFGAAQDPQLLRDQILNQRPARQQRPRNAAPEDRSRPSATAPGNERSEQGPHGVLYQMYRIERQLMQQAQVLRLQQDQLRVLHAMQREFVRLTTRQLAVERGEPDPGPSATPAPGGIQGYGSASNQQPLGPGHSDLPPGLTLPEGWQLTPLAQIPPPAPPFVPQSTTQHPIIPHRANGASSVNTSQEVPAPTPTLPVHVSTGPNPPNGSSTDALPNGEVTRGQALSNSQPADTMPAPLPQNPVQDVPQESSGSSAGHDPPPSWGFRPASSDSTMPKTSSDPEPSTGENGGSANGHVASDKGKEKVATVEDAVDEEASQ